MDRRTLKADTEKFVRAALAHSSEQKPSEKNIRNAVGEIVRAFEPVVISRREKKPR
jgi:hypothetical protein